MMDDLIKVVGAGILAVGGLFFFVIFSTLMGGVVGWSVGLIFGDPILRIASQVGIKHVSMWEFGLFMGFIGGFLKTKVSHEKG